MGYTSMLTPPGKRFESSALFEQIKSHIQMFEKNIDDQHEVGLRFASFGQTSLMLVTDIGYEDPNLFIFHGYMDGNKSVLIQHSSQLNFVLVSVPKTTGNARIKIGFTVR